MAYEYDNLGNPKLVPDTGQGKAASVVPTGAPTDTKIDGKPVQTVMTPEQMQNAAVKTENDLVKANIFAKTPAAQVYNPNPQSAEGVASDYRRVMQSIAQNPKGSVGSGVNTVKAAHSAPQITSMEDLAKAMGYTSPEEEARLQKASIANRRMLAITDALRHIGNIANTVRYAPSQQFNSPVLEDERRYREGKALRDAANARYISYKQAKERQDALIKRYEDELQFKRDKEAAAAKDRAQKMKDTRDKWQTGYDKAQDRFEKTHAEKVRHNKEMEATSNRRVDIQAAKSGGKSSNSSRITKRKGKNGTVYEFWDKNGNHHTATTVAGIDALAREYAPEIPRVVEYTKPGNVKATRQTTVSERIGDANSRYRPRGNNRKSQTVKGSGSWGSFSIHK